MTEPSLDASLVCGVMPSGRIDVRADPTSEEAPRVAAAAARRILQAFEAGRGQGVLHLGAAQLGVDLHPSIAYWRDFGQAFVARVCASLDPTEPRSLVVPELSPEEGESFAESVPPMPGAELVTPAFLEGLWSDLAETLAAEAAKERDGVQGYLRKHSSVWNVVGRVCLHLAENKRDPEYPFAFLATYVHKVSRQARPQHLPLGRALKEYAGAKNREKLLALLSPLSRAASESALLRELVDSGEVYHPLSWTPAEAHRFLCEVPLYEKAGLVVRPPTGGARGAAPVPR